IQTGVPIVGVRLVVPVVTQIAIASEGGITEAGDRGCAAAKDDTFIDVLTTARFYPGGNCDRVCVQVPRKSGDTCRSDRAIELHCSVAGSEPRETVGGQRTRDAVEPILGAGGINAIVAAQKIEGGRCASGWISGFVE